MIDFTPLIKLSLTRNSNSRKITPIKEMILGKRQIQLQVWQMQFRTMTKNLTSLRKEMRKGFEKKKTSNFHKQTVVTPTLSQSRNLKKVKITIIDIGLNELIKKKLKYYLNNFIQWYKFHFIIRLFFIFAFLLLNHTLIFYFWIYKHKSSW